MDISAPQTVLIVDDDPLLRTELRTLLSRAQPACWRTLEADSVRSALHQQQHATHIDIALVDVHLPDGTALDFVRQAGPLPCIICTQDQREPTFSALFQNPDIAHNLVGYLTKPLEPGVLWSIRAGLEIGRERELRSRAVAEATARIEQERLGLAERLRDGVEVALTQLSWALDEIQEGCLALARHPHDAKHVSMLATHLSALRANGAQRIQRLQQDLASTLSRLLPVAVDLVGLSQATEQLVQEWRATAPQVSFSLVADPQADQLEAHHASLIFKLIQDAITLAMRSTAAQHVDIKLRRQRPDWMTFQVSTQGLSRFSHHSEHVLAALKTRATALGGGLQFECHAKRGGSHLQAQWPVCPPRPCPSP